jgi:hypothetical protein
MLIIALFTAAITSNQKQQNTPPILPNSRFVFIILPNQYRKYTNKVFLLIQLENSNHNTSKKLSYIIYINTNERNLYINL